MGFSAIKIKLGPLRMTQLAGADEQQRSQLQCIGRDHVAGIAVNGAQQLADPCRFRDGRVVFLDHRRQRSFEVHRWISLGARGLHGIAKHLSAALAGAMCGFVNPAAFDALLLPGGHRARGMREYLESEILQRHVAGFFDQEKPVAAICHGVLLAARSISKRTGRSVLSGYRTTALTWAFENSAWSVARVTRFWDPNYYRTYLEQDGQPKGFMSVQQEVTRALASADDFRDVPTADTHYRRKTSGLVRDSMDDKTPAFVVRDRNYVSARWPGDVHTFAKTFSGMLK